MIELKNISFSYANNCEDSQLRHIDLTVKKGELIILAGKSGCGPDAGNHRRHGLRQNNFDEGSQRALSAVLSGKPYRQLFSGWTGRA